MPEKMIGFILFGNLHVIHIQYIKSRRKFQSSQQIENEKSITYRKKTD